MSTGVTEKDASEATDYTRELAEFSLDLSHGDLPVDIVDLARLFTLETLSHMVAATRTRVAHVVGDYVRELGAKPEAAVVGMGFRTTAAEAAYVNGTLAHGDELESYAPLAGSCMIPPVAAGLAVGDWLESPGDQYLAAMVAGVEMSGRLGTAGLGGPDRGFMGISLVGPAGATVTAAKLIGLDVEQLRNALGVALPFGGGTTRNTGFMAHIHEAGVPSRIGVWAAIIASRGFTACPDYLDGRYSWGDQFAGGGGRGYIPEALTEGLGASYFIQTSGAAPKKYGSCAATHAGIDGLVDLMTEHDLGPDDIATVDLRVSPFFRRICHIDEPRDAEQAKFCFRQALGGVLVGGIPELPYLHAFTDSAATDPRYVAARQRVTVSVDPQQQDVRIFDPNTVTVTLPDGRTFSKTVEPSKVRGRHEAPLTVEERTRIARNAMLPVLGAERADAVISMVDELERHTIRELMSLTEG
ncbi:MAG: MmgE/PrpD family protein [Acidimicrobiia bacterium]